MFQLSGGYRPTGNTAGFQSDQYVALADASQSEADPAKRQQIYSQINDLLLDESFNISIGFQPTYMVATRKRERRALAREPGAGVRRRVVGLSGVRR